MDEKSHQPSVIIGLGNPGKKYEYTRHNVGYLVVKAFAGTLGWIFKEEKRFDGWVAKDKWDEKFLHLILPGTYMNESGRCVRAYLDFYKLTPADIIVINDDVELPFGEIRLRLRGGAGGHNGLKSIANSLGTQDYMRLKIGVGKDLQKRTLADYVLDAFKPEEFALLPALVERGANMVKDLVFSKRCE